VFYGSALGANAHRYFALLCSISEAQVDGLGFGCAACHGTDQQGCRHRLAEQAEARVDAFQIQLGESLMGEAVLFEAGGQCRAYILFQVDFYMVGFSLVNWRNFCHEAVFL